MGIKMGQNEIEKIFFENPVKRYHIRGISRQFKMPKSTVSRHVHNLIKKGIVIKEKEDIFPAFKADQSGKAYRFHKRQYILEKIIKSGLIEFIEEECMPNCIVLFGSMSKGEYDTKSDIDIFVQAEESDLELRKFEKKLGFPINLLFSPKIQDVSDRLINSLANSAVLSGFMKVR